MRKLGECEKGNADGRKVVRVEREERRQKRERERGEWGGGKRKGKSLEGKKEDERVSLEMLGVGLWQFLVL